jgi:hypothetical protein
MSDEQIVTPPVEETAPVLEATAAPETVESTPEKTEEASKTFTQEELDAIVGKRLAREQRKWEREQSQKLRQPETTPRGEIKADDFESTEAYVEALAEKKAQDLLNQRESHQRKVEVESVYREREEAAFDKYEDFEAVAYNPRLPISEAMAEAIQSSDVGPDVAYYLGSNPKEAARIAQLSPIQQAREIGKIEVKLTTTPPTKKTSSAPAPITPVTAKHTGAPVVDTTDPRSVKNMSTSDWIAAENERERKKLEAKYR